MSGLISFGLGVFIPSCGVSEGVTHLVQLPLKSGKILKVQKTSKTIKVGMEVKNVC